MNRLLTLLVLAVCLTGCQQRKPAEELSPQPEVWPGTHLADEPADPDYTLTIDGLEFDPRRGLPDVPEALRAAPNECPYWIIQFHEHPTDAQVEAVVEVLGRGFWPWAVQPRFISLDMRTWIVRTGNPVRFRDIQFIRAAVPYIPALKVHGQLYSAFADGRLDSDEPMKLWLCCFPGWDARVQAELERLGGKTELKTDHCWLISVPKREIVNVVRLDHVMYMEEYVRPELFRS